MPLGQLGLELLTERPAPVYEGFVYLNSEIETGIIAGIGTEPALYVELNISGGQAVRPPPFSRMENSCGGTLGRPTLGQT
jgi:hypothetical protein